MENDLRRQGEGDWEAFERGVDAALANRPLPRSSKLAADEPSVLAFRQGIDARVAAARSVGLKLSGDIIRRVLRDLILNEQEAIHASTNRTRVDGIVLVISDRLRADLTAAAEYVHSKHF